MENLSVHARVAVAATARETADLARGVLGDVSTPMVSGDLIRKARRVRREALVLVDRAVLAELAGGADVEDVAAALGLTVSEMLRIHGPTWAEWQAGAMAGSGADYGSVGADPADTAETLDQWWRRHSEPWESAGDDSTPVGRLLVEG